MKHLLLILLFTIGMSATGQSQKSVTTNYARQWKQIDALMDDNLPRSADSVAMRIHQQATKEKNTVQAFKSLVHHHMFIKQVSENKLPDVYDDIVKRIPTAWEPYTQLLHGMAAQCLIQYHNNHRYQLMNRQTSAIETDVRLMNIPQLAQLTIAHLEQSLMNPSLLKSINVNQYTDILTPGNKPTHLRPTLYDVWVWQAIVAYLTTDFSIDRFETPFALDNPNLFADSPTFAAIEATPADSCYPYRAFRLMQAMTQYRLSDTQNQEALWAAELDRINLMHQYFTGANNDQLYTQAIEALHTRTLRYPISALVAYYRALMMQQTASKSNSQLKDAVALCRQTVKAWPDAEGGKLCRDMIASITHPSINLQTEHVYLPHQQGLMQVNVKSCKSLVMTILKWPDQTTPQNNYPDADSMAIVVARTPILLKQTIALPDDINTHHDYSASLALPALKPGRYVVVLSNVAVQNPFKGVMAYEIIEVSSVATTCQSSDGATQVSVNNRQSGQPIAQAKVTAWIQNNNRNEDQSWQSLPPVITDTNGIVQLQGLPSYTRFVLMVQTPEGTVWGTSGWQSRKELNINESQQMRMSIFTDRQIYRPGQTVFYKAILMGTNGKEASSREGQNVTLSLRDFNGNEIGTHNLTTNQFGSCSGSFQLPKVGITGQWSLVSQFGSKYFSIEEYKRPKFEVQLLPIEGAYALGDTLTITGKAISYSGVNLAGAQGRYKIIKSLPYRPYMWRGIPNQSSEEVAAGTFTVNNDGGFSFALISKTEKEYETESFLYRITADITDINGETQSAQKDMTVSAQHSQLELSLPETLVIGTDSVKAMIHTTNMDNQPVSTNGTYRIVRVVPVVSAGMGKPALYWQNSEWNLAPDSVSKKFTAQGTTCPTRDELVAVGEFHTTAGFANITFKGDAPLQPGEYRLMANLSGSIDTIVAETSLLLCKDDTMPFAEHLQLALVNKTDGDSLCLMVGSIDANAIVMVEAWDNTQQLLKQRVVLNGQQRVISLAAPVQRPASVTARVYLIKDNRYYSKTTTLQLPKKDASLNIKIETMREKPTPGGKETIRIKIEGADADKQAAELLAGMYDASLDAYAPNSWNMQLFYPRYAHVPDLQTSGFGMDYGNMYDRIPYGTMFEALNYRYINWFDLWVGPGRQYLSKSRGAGNFDFEMNAESDSPSDLLMVAGEVAELAEVVTVRQEEVAPPTPPMPDLSAVSIRKNLNETAFFYPHLITDSLGGVSLTYTVPESLTKWHLMMLAHNRKGQTGTLNQYVITSKNVMVVPEVPRFVREDDQLWLNAKIANQTDTALMASVMLEIVDANTQLPLKIITANAMQTIQIDAKGSASVQWPVTIPQNHNMLIIRVKASAGNHTDGEEHWVPVLPNKVLVREALPIVLNKPGKYKFKLDNLTKASNTIQHQQLTFTYTQNTAWEVLKALPYLMEYPYECSEQVFSRLFGYAMGQTIVAQHPAIANAIKGWALSDDALKSPLEQNETVKSIVNEETPWQRAGENETANRRRLILLTDENAVNRDIDQAIAKLKEMQFSDGGWCWFKGMAADAYITRHILIGLGQLQKAGSAVCNKPEVIKMMQSGAGFLQMEFEKQYNLMKKDSSITAIDANNIQLIYAISFYKPQYEKASTREAIKWMLSRMKATPTSTIMEQAMMAIINTRFNKQDAASKTMASLREQAITDDKGQAWFRTSNSWHWSGNQVETIAMALEAFNETAPNDPLIASLQNKLVSLKKVQAWPTTRSTTMAVWGMMSPTRNLFEPITHPDLITIGNKNLAELPSTKSEALSGSTTHVWHGKEINTSMGNITIQKQGDTPSRGAMHWSYFTPINDVKATSGDVRVTRHLFVETVTSQGTRLIPVTESEVRTGDRLLVRLEIESALALDYVHLKDSRSSILEPESVFSQYKWQGGLSYYQSVRDASMNFFIHHLPKGTHVLEYGLRVRGKGITSNGFATIECMYAPEYEAHSESTILNTK